MSNGRPQLNGEELPAGTVGFNDQMARIEQLLQRFEQCDSATSAGVKELVQTLLDLHGKCLQRILQIIGAHYEGGSDLNAEFARDEVISSLLLVHGLHPVDFETRVRQAVDRIRPILAAHGGNVELVEIQTDRVIRLALKGNCNGCRFSSQTLTSTIEQAIYNAAPEVHSIELYDVAREIAEGTGHHTQEE